MVSSIYLAHEWVNPMVKFYAVSWRNIKQKNKTAFQGTSHVFYWLTPQEKKIQSEPTLRTYENSGT